MRNNGGLLGLLLFLVTITAREGMDYISEHLRERWAGRPALNKRAIFRASTVKFTILCAMYFYAPGRELTVFSVATD